jgi:hypothetical protein
MMSVTAARARERAEFTLFVFGVEKSHSTGDPARRLTESARRNRIRALDIAR